MNSRRQFLAASAAAGLFPLVRTQAKTSTPYPYSEFENRIARHDFQGMTKDILPTPCMMVDLDLFEQNIRKMADNSKGVGINVRPHVKVHKSVEVAKRQIALGAIGLTVATIAEAELMSGSGLQGVLWTKQPASQNNIYRAVALSKRDPSFMFVVDAPEVVDWVEEAASASKVKCRLAVSVFASMPRQGIEAGQPALALAQKISSSPRFSFEGYMAYSGTAAHTKGFEDRCKRSSEDLAGVRETIELSKKCGLPVNLVSGGSTGTYNIDKNNGLTELEAGSYVFMDTGYWKIGGRDGNAVYSDFSSALTVLTTVDGKLHPNLATTDYGNKAMARPTDSVKDKPWLEVDTQGAEYGALRWKDGAPELKLGDRVEIYPTNLDVSTAAYDRYYVTRGDQVIDIWPIMGRGGAPQR
jgi:D-serine deaminase-like pyridoxal phosphate-dependent protein